MKTVSLIIKVFILLIFLVLAVINRQAVQFNYLPEQSVNAPLIVLLFGMFVIGALFGIFALFGRQLQKSWMYRCRNCHFKSQVFFWHCPACNKWETFTPGRIEI